MIQAEEDVFSITCHIRPQDLKLDIVSMSGPYKINTSRTILPGQTIDLAEFVQNLNDDKNNVSIKSGVHLNKKSQTILVQMTIRAQ